MSQSPICIWSQVTNVTRLICTRYDIQILKSKPFWHSLAIQDCAIPQNQKQYFRCSQIKPRQINPIGTTETGLGLELGTLNETYLPNICLMPQRKSYSILDLSSGFKSWWALPTGAPGGPLQTNDCQMDTGYWGNHGWDPHVFMIHIQDETQN
jgi:hypothetical protein